MRQPMRYPKDHKQKIRERLLEDTARHVKQHGFAGSGVDAIAASAGVTSGALYKHFAGKSDLLAAVVAMELERTAERFAAVPTGDAEAAQRALAAYLSLAHVQRADAGCPLPALTPEVGRADATVRQAFQLGLADVHAQVEKMTASSTAAWALIAQCVGAVMLARAMPDQSAERRDLLDAASCAGSALLAAPASRPAKERTRRGKRPGSGPDTPLRSSRL